MRPRETARALQQMLRIQHIKSDQTRLELAAKQDVAVKNQARRDEAMREAEAALDYWSASLTGRFDALSATAQAEWVRQCEVRLANAEVSLAAAQRDRDEAQLSTAEKLAEVRAAEHALKREQRMIARQALEEAQHRLDERTSYAWARL